MINIDFETRSRCDLLAAGVYNYFADPSTEVVCMAYSVDGAEPELWLPGDPVPKAFNLAGSRLFGAWNSTFERLCWDYIMEPEHGFPHIDLDQWLCTAYMARCNNMPNALGNAARCLNVEQQKTKRGTELIKLLSVPQADGTFCEDPELLGEFYEYCLQDVRTEMAVRAQLREPTADEWADFFANERINDRGVRVDVPLCDAAQVYAAEEEADLVGRIVDVTEGAVVKARGEKLKAWVVERLTDEQERLLVKYRGGERKLSLDKWNRFRLLALDDIDPDVREVVECSDFAQKSSVGKFRAMSALADPEDHRVRGSLMCNGASASGRASSRGMQVHNFPRDCMKDPVEVRADFMDNIVAEDIVDYYEYPMMTVLSRMLRPALVPAPGRVFLDSDWSSIEGRVGPWLCANKLGDKKVDLYASGAPVYELAAAATFGVAVEDVTPDQRQIGKVEELSFQYAGGAKAFLAMARNYGIAATPAEAEKYKNAWRRANPWAADKSRGIWARIEGAVHAAMRSPGQQFPVGRLNYFCVEGVLCGGLTLFCQLPCGRLLTYPDVRMEYVPAPWDETEMIPAITVLRAAFVPKVGEKEWPRTSIYGGLLFENATQGTAASLLRWAVREAEYNDLDVVFHVHDQLVVESGGERLENDKAILEEIMNDTPPWAEGLPVEADVIVAERFGK